MSGDGAGQIEGEAHPAPVRFTCSCGGTVAADRKWRGPELDLTTVCGECGRRHVVTITEVQRVPDPSPTSRDR